MNAPNKKINSRNLEYSDMIQIYSGITHGRVLNGELGPEEWRQIFTKQSVDKYRCINFTKILEVKWFQNTYEL